MNFTRRQILAGMAAGVTSAAAQDRRADGPKLRTSPAVCLYSKAVIKVPYDELGPILKAIGVDGCDLAVQRDGHVSPDKSNVDLMRAIEAITGVGLDVPVITTDSTSLADPTIRNVAAIAGEMGVPLFRAGHWKYAPAGDLEPRLQEVQRDLAGLASLARAVNMTVLIQNLTGDMVGQSIWDSYLLMRGLDTSVGYDFDLGYATADGGAGGWFTSMRLARPRLKMVTARDFIWSKDGGTWKMVPCPLGEGMVDWPKAFAMLASMRFTGPISIPVDHHPKDELPAIQRDVEFVRKQLKTAYGG